VHVGPRQGHVKDIPMFVDCNEAFSPIGREMKSSMCFSTLFMSYGIDY